MPVSHRVQALSVAAALTACGPEADAPLADASWIIGRYATGGCSFREADGSVYSYMETCVTRDFAEVEFFEDGRVESSFFGCQTTEDSPARIESYTWRATTEDGVVEVLPSGENPYVGLYRRGLTAVGMEARPADECGQVYVEAVFDDQPPGPNWDVLHRGEYSYFDPLPSDGCEMEAYAVEAPLCEDPP
jgi:hypothetical protein